MKKPKIVFIASYAESIINFRLHLIKEFLKLGYTVSVFAPTDKRVADELEGIGVNFVGIQLDRNGRNPLRDLQLLLRLYVLMKRENPDIVFSYTIKPVIYGSVIAKLAGVRNIFSMITGSGYIFSDTNLKTRLVGFIAKQMFRFSLRFNKKIFFQNKDNVELFKNKKLISNHQSLTIINGSGVDINFFTSTKLPQQISFLMISRFLYDKGIREYLQAARMVKKRHPDVQFKLVGWIDTNPNSITQAELSQWVDEGIIEYFGKLADVRDAIAGSSVYVLPSYGEGTPRTVLEAMAMSRPIITTDVPGCRETVIHKRNGFLIPVRDVEALCTAMLHFIDNPYDIEKMGIESRRIALEKYDVNKVNKSILSEMEVTNEINTQTIFENTL